jgi:hypothetical protein
MFIIYIIYKFEYSTSLVYYLVFYYLHCTMMNLHGLNCYCWDFIINIYIYFL